MRRFVLLLPAVLLATSAIAAPLQLNAKAAYVVHPATGTVVFSQNGDEQMGPASLTKMMTLYILFTRIKDGSVKMTDEFPVSEKAWRMQGSKMFVDVGKTVPVEKLIQGIAVVSGNDACIVVAEKLGGTEDGFVAMMNKQAEAFGMSNTHFADASGMPDPSMHSTARDIAILAQHLLLDFPEYKHFLEEEDFTWNGIHQQNRNGLLHAGAGVDFGKTGHTDEAGYHLASSAVQNNERLLTVVMGTDGFKTREGESLKAYATFFAQNKTHAAAEPGKPVVESVPVWHGVDRNVALTVQHPLAAFLNADDLAKAKVTATYKQPLVAPLAADAPVGEITLTLPSGQTMTEALVPAHPVDRAGFGARWWQTFLHMVGLA